MENFHQVCAAYLRTSASPFCLSALNALERKDWVTLVNLKVDPRSYTNASAYFMDAQAAALFTKNRSLVIPEIDVKQRTKEVWFAAEARCAHTNHVLNCLKDGSLEAHQLQLLDFLAAVKRNMRKWLGKAPELADLEPRFGPGVTICCKKTSTVADKLTNPPSTTPNAYLAASLTGNKQRGGDPSLIKAMDHIMGETTLLTS